MGLSEELAKSPAIRMAGSDGHVYSAEASRAGEMAKAALAEGVELKPFIRTQDAEGKEHEYSPFDEAGLRGAAERGETAYNGGADAPGAWSWEGVKAGLKGMFVDPNGENGTVTYMLKNLASGLGTAATTVARGIAKGTLGTATAALAGIEHGVRKIAGSDTRKPGFLGAVNEGVNGTIDWLTPDIFEKRGQYDGIDGAAETVGSVRGLAEMVANLKGIGNLTKGYAALTKSAKAAHGLTGASFGLAKYGEMGEDPNGPGGIRQEAAALVAGGVEGVIFGLWSPFRLGTEAFKAASPFLQETRAEVTKRFIGRMLASGADMAAVSATREGAERLATVGLEDAEGHEVRWNEKTWQEVAKTVGSEFLVGSAFAVVDPVGKSLDWWMWRRAKKRQGADLAATGKLKVAMSYQVEKNREAYAPMLNAEAERALATAAEMAARRRDGVAPDGAGAARLEPVADGARRTVDGADGAADAPVGKFEVGNVSEILEGGAVKFTDGSVWRRGRDGAGATITVADGTILDAATGRLVGYAAGETKFEKGAGAAGEAPDGAGAGEEARRIVEGAGETVGVATRATNAADGWATNAAWVLDAAASGKMPVDRGCSLEGLEVSTAEFDAPRRIEGAYERKKSAPIVVFVGEDGRRVAVTGAGRIAAAEASGEGTVDAVYVYERDGWTERTAQGIGALENVREGRGTIRDLVRSADAVGGADALVEIGGRQRAAGNVSFADDANRAATVLRRGTRSELIAAVRDGEMDGRTGYTIAKNLGVDSVGAEWRAAQDAAMRLADEMGYDELLTVVHAVRVAAAKRGWTGSRREIDDAIAEGRRRAGATADREPVETADGRMLTVGEVEAEMGKGRGEVEAPGGAGAARLEPGADGAARLDGADGAANGGATAIFDAAARTGENRGVDLVAREDGSFGVARWPKARIEVSAEGIRVEGLRIEDLTGEGNLADAAAFVARVRGLAEKTGKGVLVGDADVAEALRLIEGEIRREGMEVYGAERVAEFGRLVERLSESLPTAKVTHDAASFEAAMSEAGTRAWRDSKYETYGCVTKDGRICLNPLVVDFDTPLHEYGHLALDVARNANAALVERGLKLARASEEYRRIAEDPVYAKQGEAAMAEEALVHLIAARGEALVKERGIGEKLKAWLSEFWKSFGDAVGIRDLTGEQISRMTMADVADAIGSEMLGGREFGSARAERGAARLEAGAGAFVRIGEGGAEVVRPTRKAVRRRTRKPFGIEAYDESQESGRNGLLRWAKDNDGLLRIPIDRERTVPGGEVKFKADDANVTDWIIRRLNGRRLVLTKNGAIALKGRNGKVEFPTGELRDLFGAKFKEGSNDGLGEKLAAELGESRWERATIEEIADALGKDRRNYAAWVERQKTVRRGERPATDEERYYMEQAEREESFRREEVEAGGERYRGEDLLDAEAAKASAAWEEADYDRWVASEIAAGRFKRGRENVRRISREGVTAAEDAAYLDAVRRGDAETAKRLLRTAWERSGYASEQGYRGSHAAPGASVGRGEFENIERLTRANEAGESVNLWGIANGISPVPEDFFTAEGYRRYGHADKSSEEARTAVAAAMREVRGGKGEATISVYRAVPKGVRADALQSGGQWVSPSRTYAEEHGAANLNGDYRIIEQKVRAADLWWDGNDIREWGYDDGRQYVYRDGANGMKLATVTYDDAGEVIPLSRRFDSRQGDIRFKRGDGDREELSGIGNTSMRINPNIERDVREALAGDAKGNPVGRRKEVSFSDMPEMLKAVGIPDLPIRTRADIVRKLKGEHGFTERQIASLPKAYDKPVAVFADGKAFVVLTEMQIASRGGDAKPVMVVLRESVGRNGWHEFLASAYPREGANENFYEGLAKNGRMLFLDKNKVAVIGLNGRTISTLNKQADGNRVKTPEDFTSIVSPRSIAQNGDGAQGGARFGRSGVTGSVFRYAPTKGAEAIGETEGNGAGIAGGEEKSAALRPWTRAGSPCAEAKPIAFDAADLLQFWRRVVDGGRFRVAKGEHVPGRKNAVGVNAGGKDITVAARLFGMFDAGDRARLKEELKGRGFWRNEDLEWCAGATKEEIAAERARSAAKLDEEIGRLVKERVLTGKGGEHYAAEVMAHEIAHTLAKMPGGDLGPTMNAAKTLLDEMSGALRKGEGAAEVKAETARLIAWWHGTDEMPNYYRRDSERFAEVFGIFLTQPEGVKAQSPRVYEICRELLSKNQRAWSAYHEICSEKWNGTSNERILREIERTWDGEFAARAAKLNADMNAGSWKKVDELNYALNDRYGPMFALGMRNVKAERKRLAGEVAAGRMTQGEADARIGSMERTVTALRSGLYDLQRLEGGEARLMVSGFNDVIEGAVKDGVNWTDVRRYAHLMRVIEIGGRATAHGVDPSRAAAMLDEMSARLGEEGYGRVEETWKKFRAVYERFVLDDARVQRMFDGQTNAMLRRNAHYVTMRHTVGVEDLADYERRVKEFEATGRGDPTEFMTAKIVRGLSGIDGRDGVYRLHRLTGSVDATTDPIVATVKKAVEIKRAAVRNELVRSLAKMVTECGVKDSLDGAARTVENERFGTLAYLEGGETRRLVVPKIIAKSFTAKTGGELREFGAAMRALRNTMTLWNPAFINRAYLLDKAALETNLKGMHKSAVDVIAGAIPFARLPNYAMENYFARFTGFTKTWLGRLLYNEHTVNYYVRDAQKIADIVYKGRFGEEARRAAELRKAGDTSGAAEIEARLGIAQEMLRRNVFQSSWEFNKLQSAATVGDVAHAFGLEQSAADAKGWRGAVKKAGRAYNRYEEEQEAVTKIVAWLYDAKTNPNRDADARARLVIEQGGTPNLSARGVLATHIENATGFFWNVRKEATLRTWRAFRDHPQEWAAKAVAQTVLPAVMKGFAVMGGLKWLFLNYVFDNDEKRLQQSALAPVINYYEWMGRALRNVPGYQQRNYNVIPLWTPPEGGTFALRVKYAPEEFAAVNAVHAAMNAWMPNPTDPDANIDTALQSMRTELLPDLLGDNPAAMLVSAVLNPLLGENVHDNFRGRDIYSDDAIVARWTAPKYLAAEMARNVVNYSPIGSLVAAIPDPKDKMREVETPGALDVLLNKVPVLSKIPASCLGFWATPSRTGAIAGAKRLDDQYRAKARLIASDVLAKCVQRGTLAGADADIGKVDQTTRSLVYESLMRGWRAYWRDVALDERSRAYKVVKNLKYPAARAIAERALRSAYETED